MRTLLSLCTGLMLISSCGANDEWIGFHHLTAAEQASKFVQITYRGNDGVNIRSQSRVQSSKLGTLYFGMHVELLDVADTSAAHPLGKWIKISTNWGTVGWIAAYLTSYTSMIGKSTEVIYSGGDGAIIRSGPSTLHAQLATVYQDAPLRVRGQVFTGQPAPLDHWLGVTLSNGSKGWIAAYLTNFSASGVPDVPNGEISGHWIRIGGLNTYLKKRITDGNGRNVQSDDLSLGSEKCTLYANARIPIQTVPRVVGNHYEINTQKLIPGCSFSKGYVYMEHVNNSSANTQNTPKPSVSNPRNGMTKKESALLATIAYAEGTNDSYNYSFGFHTFSSYADHPRVIYGNCAALCSDAAGRYQMMSYTWDEVRPALRLRDFSPASQDKAALYLIRTKRGVEPNSIHDRRSFERAIYGLNNEWASLPGSPYGQPLKSMQELWNVYSSHMR